MYFGIYTHNKHDKNSSDGVFGLFVLQCVCSLVLLQGTKMTENKHN